MRFIFSAFLLLGKYREVLATPFLSIVPNCLNKLIYLSVVAKDLPISPVTSLAFTPGLSNITLNTLSNSNSN